MSVAALNLSNAMGRRRNPENAWMPKGVQLDKYGYYLRKPYKRLAPADADRSTVWRAYEQYVHTDDAHTLAGLIRRYLTSDRFFKLAPKTQKECRRALERLSDRKIKGGTFGGVQTAQVTPGVIRRYLDSRESKTMANREIAYLSAAFSWAFERDQVKSNPCRGVRRNTETRRERYVTDEEYRTLYQRAPDRVQIIMELAYLCAARKIEVLDLLPEGVLLRRRKGSKDNVVKWSPRLEAVVNRALGLPSEIASVWLIHDRKGQPIKSTSLDTAWHRLQPGFRFHDLKKKGVSDSASANPAGHRSPAMVALYNVKRDEVEPPG